MDWTYCEYCDDSLRTEIAKYHTCMSMPDHIFKTIRDQKNSSPTCSATVGRKEFQEMEGNRNFWRNIVRDAVGLESGDPDPDGDKVRRILMDAMRKIRG